ncbi:hypothetical protein PanWU01x14_112980 [Parasponia andersonii]|uniref:Uncharacterized protein n=1 Tax=Parasponia andersonii TaxID=3476 RepID=A0A2P5CYG0_PARAD|nr:hypothetical protein PanWU01x14_112980 [Parasponia andersonii]
MRTGGGGLILRHFLAKKADLLKRYANRNLIETKRSYGTWTNNKLTRHLFKKKQGKAFDILVKAFSWSRPREHQLKNFIYR